MAGVARELSSNCTGRVVIAAPVFDFQNNLAGAICVWSLRERAGLSKLRKLIPALIDSTRRVSQKLGQASGLD